MSVLDAFRGLLSGSGKNALPVAMAEGEVEVTRAVASFQPGGLTSVGGDLVLTTKRLVFTPLNVTPVAQALTWALGKAGVPDVLAGLPEKIGERVIKQDFSDLSGIAGVAAGRPPTLLRPPTLIVTATDGTVSEIGVLKSRLSPSMSAANAVERDRMIAAVRAAIRGE